MLEQAAAARWNVAVSEVAAKNHAVVHAASGRTLSYGALAEAASKLPAPDKATLKFKPAESYRIVGTNVPITDIGDLVSGKGTFGIDAKMPGMVYAAVATVEVVIPEAVPIALSVVDVETVTGPV